MERPNINRAHYFISSAALIFSRILVSIGSFAVVVILAAKFGVAALTDAYFVARMIPITLLSPLGIAYNLAFVPVYMHACADVDKASDLASSFFNGTLIVSALLTIIYLVFADPIVSLIAPGFSPETHASAVWMTRIMAPAIILTSLHAVFDSLLNAQRRFLASALSSLFVPAGAILGISLMADQWGTTGLAAGVVAGYIAQAAFLFPTVRRYFSGGFFALPRLTIENSQIIRFLGLSIFVISVWQINTVIDRMFGSLLGEGSVSALGLGSAIIGLIPIIVAAPVYKVLYPELVQQVKERRYSDISRLLRDNFIVVVFMTLPVAAMLMMFAPVATQLAFGYGQFDDSNAYTTQVIFYGALGLPASISNILLVYYFLVTRSVKLIVATSIISIIANIVLNWILIKIMGIGGIALATSLIILFRTGAMAFIASRQLGESIFFGTAVPFMKTVGATLIAVIVMYNFAAIFNLTSEEESMLVLLARTMGLATVGGGVYILVNLGIRNEALMWLLGTVQQLGHKNQDIGKNRESKAEPE